MTKTKYLLATALLALCISLAAGMASAQVGWVVGNQDLPSDIAWDDADDASVGATHTGSGQLNPGTYGLVSVDGVTGAATAVDRWGRVTAPAPPVYFMGGATVLHDFTITGPALTTMQYTAPVGLTAPGVPLTVDCNWILASPLAPTPAFLLDDTAVQDTVVSRFPDVGQLVVGWYYIEQLAGRVPLVVKGYPNGSYGPTVAVDRQQMAIFMARALNLPLLAYAGTFADVTTSVVGWEHIEALARANIVKGFSPTVYAPAGIVSREQMAIFVSRGMAGGDANVPSGPAVASFPDVATTDVSYKYVEYCVAAGVVGGYGDGTYRPLVDVTREQMAIFVWRGFMMATGVPVVIGGPAAVGEQPSAASTLGWSSVHTDPAWGYVALDALRIDWNLAVVDGPTTAWDIVLEVRAASAPTGAVLASTRTELTTGQISTLWNAAVLSGVPYLFVALDLSGLSAGEYILVALVEDSSGVEHEVGWKRAASTYVGRFFPFTVS
jgi:hypothetical protein